MKPKPTAPKKKDTKIEPTPKKEVSHRTIYVRDDEETRVGFRSYEEAAAHRSSLGPATVDYDDIRRVRICYRNRTDTWDVVVKLARQVPNGT